ncbi:MAG: GNAT family N-acetyltransferase [Gammaproteobacteria bacterium]|nr:GNAT family N-acetyltransferase [Gammaproteobacteria bacterium]
MIELRDFHPSDLHSLVILLNNENVARYLSTRIPFPYSESDADWWISTGSKEGLVKAISVEESLIGCVGATPGSFEESRTAEIGYWIGEPYWGFGYATAAVQRLTSTIFSDTDIVRIFAPVFSPNLASMRVLEKCGYELEGVFRKACYKDEQYYDKHIFSKVHS